MLEKRRMTENCCWLGSAFCRLWAPSTTFTRAMGLRGQGVYCSHPPAANPPISLPHGHPQHQIPLPHSLLRHRLGPLPHQTQGSATSPITPRAEPLPPSDPGLGPLPDQTQGKTLPPRETQGRSIHQALTCSAGSEQRSAQNSGGSRCLHRSGYSASAVTPCRAASGAPRAARPQSPKPMLHLRARSISAVTPCCVRPHPSLGGKPWADTESRVPELPSP